ncbi:MAG: carbohydrate ABC transporter permease [Treponema sp.]|nr:carbohydrate ABC transporter permease [Treponema sp.]
MRKTVKKLPTDLIFDIINYAIMVIIILLVAYPLYFIIIASFSDPIDVMAGKVWLWPLHITFEGYQRIMKDNSIWLGYRNSIFYTVTGTTLSVITTLLAAYSLSRKDLAGRGILMKLVIFTMIFSGGLIPRYMTVRSLGMVNTIWAMIFPAAIAAYNLTIARSFFESTIPDELLDAARIDGCANWKFFFLIVVPISSAIIAVMILFYGVSNWNEFFDAMIFLDDKKLFPLQLILRSILIQSQAQMDMIGDIDSVEAAIRTAEQIKYGVIIVASLPVLVLYPALQKYFVKGVMIGSIKG